MSRDSSYHARKRMRERFGVDLSQELTEALISRINSRSLLVESENKEDNTTVYKTTIGGQVCRVVYSHRTRKIVTIMKSRHFGYPRKSDESE